MNHVTHLEPARRRLFGIARPAAAQIGALGRGRTGMGGRRVTAGTSLRIAPRRAIADVRRACITAGTAAIGCRRVLLIVAHGRIALLQILCRRAGTPWWPGLVSSTIPFSPATITSLPQFSARIVCRGLTMKLTQDMFRPRGLDNAGNASGSQASATPTLQTNSSEVTLSGDGRPLPVRETMRVRSLPSHNVSPCWRASARASSV